MGYEHTQRGPLHLILLAFAAGSGALAWSATGDRYAMAIAIGAAVLFVFVAFCFARLTVRDAGTHLAVRFGPFPLFGTRVAYSDITEVAAARSRILDGWGVHWIPGRGWIYNLWGFGCVRVGLGKKVVRIGTDDVDGLVRFLKAKLESAKPS